MPWLEKHLFIDQSQLEDAGLGLFTKVPIKKGTRIAEYRGRLQRWPEVKHEDGYNEYLLRVDRSTVLNAKPFKKCLARYANDARGLSRTKGLRNNAEYIIEGKRCFLEATRTISAGDEILVDYGEEFWILIKKIRKEKAMAAALREKVVNQR